MAGGVSDAPLWGAAEECSQPVMARLCDAGEQAAKQGSAGTFGICSYQQERSALQRLQGREESSEAGRESGKHGLKGG